MITYKQLKNKNQDFDRGLEKIRVIVLGLRGVPEVQGGVERHCQELYPRLAERNCDITILARKGYVAEHAYEYKGVKIIPIWAPKIKSLEAICHTIFGIFWLSSRRKYYDILHIHAIGPSLLAYLARRLGFRLIVTNHGPDYERQKWGKVAKFVLQLGEKIGGLYANEVIVISSVIANIVHQKCHRESNLIYNGVTLPEKSKETDFLTRIGVTPGNYLLAVARFVHEKGLHDLIWAFKGLRCDYKLVIAGEADHETNYSRNLRQMASEDDRIILTGYITGESLNQVYTYARLFVLPSYHEGLPIVLLEAMSYGLPVLVSDIPANKEVKLSAERYFRCGDVDDLRDKLEILLEKELSEEERQEIRKNIEEKYNWDKIAEQTIEVYRKALAQIA